MDAVYELENIKRIVSSVHHINVADMDKKTRKREIVQSRQISMYFASLLTKHTLSYIGNKIGRKDHATVLHAKKTVNDLMFSDPAYRIKIDLISKMIKQCANIS